MKLLKHSEFSDAQMKRKRKEGGEREETEGEKTQKQPPPLIGYC